MTSNNKIGCKNLGTGESFEIDPAPFTPETLWAAGLSENWDKLESMLRPVLGRDFAVTDVVRQAFVDLVRGALDSSVSPGHGNTAVEAALISQVERDDDVLKKLLEAGADPDLPDKKGWRPSHYCGWLSRIQAAAVLYPCRPDMAAVNNPCGDTPLAAAQAKPYDDDEEFPARAALRPAVAKMITDNKYDRGAFPSIAELACHQKWFAVKNLVRRQVVPANEFGETFSGKTAAEWARIHKQDEMAQELEYYARLPTRELLKAMSDEIEALRKQVAEQNKEKVRMSKDVHQGTHQQG